MNQQSQRLSQGGDQSKDVRLTRSVAIPGVTFTVPGVHNHFGGPGPVTCFTNVFTQPGTYNITHSFGLPSVARERAQNDFQQIAQSCHIPQGSASSSRSSSGSQPDGVPPTQQH